MILKHLKNYLFRHIQFHNDCGLCDKVFFGKHRKSQLATHLKTHQSPNGVLVQEVMPDPQLSKSRKKLSMSLKCPKCDYKTSQKKYLDEHIKGHYDCDNCGKSFYGGLGKCQLARHLKAHQS